jgi:SAM-dependent methyltransferase
LGRGKCSFCEGSNFVSFGRSPFLTRCLSCRANIPNLATTAAIRSLKPLDDRSLKAHELSSFGATFKFMQARYAGFTFSEFFPHVAGGDYVDGVRNEDVTKLSFPDNHLSLITSNGVMEHVPQDEIGYAECARVLKPGGFLIFTVPLYDTEHSVKLAELDAAGEIRWLGTPEYHDSRLGGPLSAPAFWRHSRNDICERVRKCGFSDVYLYPVMLTPVQGHPDYAIVAVK